MSSLWSQIEVLLAKNAPELYVTFRPPATMIQIRKAEKVMGIVFPEDLCEAYLRHDGCEPIFDAAVGRQFFIPYGWFCTLEKSVQEWKCNCEVIDGLECGGDTGFYIPEEEWGDLKVRPEWRNKNRIPVGLTNTESGMFIDMAPGPGGVNGQLLEDFGDGEAKVVSSSLNSYLYIFMEKFESNLISYSPSGWVSVATGDSVYDIHNIPTEKNWLSR
jgi:cell wall assembly regulator SMI1